jgi:Icc-related predicted phosphoesterase
MKAWIFSDLHLELDASLDLEIPDADICVCAGDIYDRGVVRSIEWLAERVAPFMPVVFVPGNHEYYGSAIKEGLEAGYQAAKRFHNVYLLDGDVVIFEGYRFVGATLWTDFRLQGHAASAMLAAKEQLADYRRIKRSKTPFKRFSPRESQYLHQLARYYIEEVLWTVSPRPTVIVSHHAPSLMSVPREFLKDPLTPAFASSLEPKILEYQPLVWVHGHIHHPSDYRIGNTRVVCNPRGYPGEGCRKLFNPALVVDLARAT